MAPPGSLLGNAVPRVEDPDVLLGRGTETPTPNNPLGAKGIGESGTVGSMPAVQNAGIDVASHLGVRHIDTPLTPERVWLAMRAAEAGTPS
jgi:aerobic carbon-monoxide dehydrogenase large subunit